MQKTIRLFARARDLAEAEQVTIELPDSDGTIGDLRTALGQQVPALAPLLSSLHIAVGTDYATDADPLPTNQEIAVFPPVSGG